MSKLAFALLSPFLLLNVATSLRGLSREGEMDDRRLSFSWLLQSAECNVSSISVQSDMPPPGAGYWIGNNIYLIYRVTIENVGCRNEQCYPTNVHVHCGDFHTLTEKKPVDPNLFRRLALDDCLVNNGEPLRFGEPITFEYAWTNEDPVPMPVKTATFC